MARFQCEQFKDHFVNSVVADEKMDCWRCGAPMKRIFEIAPIDVIKKIIKPPVKHSKNKKGR